KHMYPLSCRKQLLHRFLLARRERAQVRGKVYSLRARQDGVGLLGCPRWRDDGGRRGRFRFARHEGEADKTGKKCAHGACYHAPRMRATEASRSVSGHKITA